MTKLLFLSKVFKARLVSGPGTVSVVQGTDVSLCSLSIWAYIYTQIHIYTYIYM